MDKLRSIILLVFYFVLYPFLYSQDKAKTVFTPLEFYSQSHSIIIGKITEDLRIKPNNLKSVRSIIKTYNKAQKDLHFYSRITDAIYLYDYKTVYNYYLPFSKEILASFKNLNFDQNLISDLDKFFIKLSNHSSYNHDKIRQELIFFNKYLFDLEAAHQNSNIFKYIIDNNKSLLQLKGDIVFEKYFTGILSGKPYNENHQYDSIIVFLTNGVLTNKWLFKNKKLGHSSSYNYSYNIKIDSFYYDNGILRTTNANCIVCKNDNQFYKRKEFYKNGKIFSSIFYDSVAQVLKSVYYNEFGQQLIQKSESKSLQSSEFITYDSDGNITNKSISGEQINYSLYNGLRVKQSETNIKASKNHGKQVSYNSMGMIFSIDNYNHNKLLIREEYYNSGELKRKIFFDDPINLRKECHPKFNFFNIEYSIINYPSVYIYDSINNEDMTQYKVDTSIKCLNCNAIADWFNTQDLFNKNIDGFDYGLSLRFALKLNSRGKVINCAKIDPYLILPSFDTSQFNKLISGISFSNINKIKQKELVDYELNINYKIIKDSNTVTMEDLFKISPIWSWKERLLDEDKLFNNDNITEAEFVFEKFIKDVLPTRNSKHFGGIYTSGIETSIYNLIGSFNYLVAKYPGFIETLERDEIFSFIQTSIKLVHPGLHQDFISSIFYKYNRDW